MQVNTKLLIFQTWLMLQHYKKILLNKKNPVQCERDFFSRLLFSKALHRTGSIENCYQQSSCPGHAYRHRH